MSTSSLDKVSRRWDAGGGTYGKQAGVNYRSTHSLPGGLPLTSSKNNNNKGILKESGSQRGTSLPAYVDGKLLKQVRENTSKFIQHRIANVEKHFGDMCQGLGNYHRRLCKVRDTGDELAKHINTYAEKESFNTTTRESLKNFASLFSAIQDYRDTEVRRIDNKVLGPLTEYGTECKHAKEKLKQAFAARNKELKEQKNLSKVKSGTADRRSVTNVEMEVQKASIEATRASKQLENEMEVFERQKLVDIKKIFLDFVQIEMIFHARALEFYTECHNSLSSIDVDGDLEEFRSSLRPFSSDTRLGNLHTGSRTSLNTTGISNTQSVGRSTTQATTPGGTRSKVVGTPEDTMTMTNRSSMYTDTQDDDDEDESEEDEEEESEEDDTYSSKQQPRRK